MSPPLRRDPSRPGRSACTLQKVSDINWTWVILGIVIIVVLVIVAVYAAPIIANPYGGTAAAALFAIAAALIGFGATATTIVALAGC
jgi:hypothetical protein